MSSVSGLVCSSSTDLAELDLLLALGLLWVAVVLPLVQGLNLREARVLGQLCRNS